MVIYVRSSDSDIASVYSFGIILEKHNSLCSLSLKGIQAECFLCNLWMYAKCSGKLVYRVAP